MRAYQPEALTIHDNGWGTLQIMDNENHDNMVACVDIAGEFRDVSVEEALAMARLIGQSPVLLAIVRRVCARARMPESVEGVHVSDEELKSMEDALAAVDNPKGIKLNTPECCLNAKKRDGVK